MAAVRTMIADVARKLNVATSTVSRALNGHTAISDAAKVAVSKITGKSSCHHNKIASSLRSTKTKVVGDLVPGAAINFFCSVAHGVETIALRFPIDGVLAFMSKETKQPSHSPDGVFAVEDFTTLGAAQVLKATHKNVPDKLALFNFANKAFGKYITPSLSTVDQQTIKMGEKAAPFF